MPKVILDKRLMMIKSVHDFKGIVDELVSYYNNHRIKQKINGELAVQYR